MIIPKIEKIKKEKFHEMVAKLLCVMKRSYPDLDITV